MNEEVMVGGVEIVEWGHEIDEYFAEFFLAAGIDAGILEEANEKFHYLAVVLDEYTGLAFDELNDTDGRFATE